MFHKKSKLFISIFHVMILDQSFSQVNKHVKASNVLHIILTHSSIFLISNIFIDCIMEFQGIHRLFLQGVLDQNFGVSGSIPCTVSLSLAFHSLQRRENRTGHRNRHL